jgi:hypothetical protein
MKKITLLCSLFLLLHFVNLSGQNFDWESGTDNGANVTQTVSGITATVTSNDGIVDLLNAGGFDGTSGNLVFSNSGSETNMTITFDSSVNISTIYLFTADSGNGDWTLTPTGGTNSPVNESVPGSGGVLSTLNWTNVTAISITNTSGGTNNPYFGIDEITITSPCTDPDVPTVSATSPSICNGASTDLNITGSLNDATQWHVYTGSCGGTQIGTTATGTFNVSPTTTTTYYIRGEGGCVTPGSCGTVTVTVNNLDDASFSYGAAAYCKDAADPSPTITGLTGGSFSSTAGLSIASNGTIDVSASTAGTYTVTYTTAGTCPNSSTTSVTINDLDDASFSYGASSYTIDDADPSPTITGLTGGTFSSTAGLSIASNGTIDLSASSPNTYTVTYTTAGTCPNSSTFDVTVTYNNYTWTGNINNSWEQPGNWNTNVAPHSTGNAIIPSGVTNYPTIASSTTVGTISIASGASLIANASVTGNVTYTRSLPTTNWYLISSPVSGETIEDVIANHTLASGTGGNLGLAPYSNITGPAWLYVQSGSTGTISNGMGMSIKLATPADFVTTGTLNTTNVSKAISTGSRTNFNLVGNPFTAYVNSASFAASNTALLTEETIWLWDGTQYATYNAVSPIEVAPAQGFFVEAASSGNVTFSTANQSHQSSDTFMRQEPKPSFELFVENGNNKKGTKVFYVDNKTTGFDNGYDSKIFEGVSVDFGVFTQLVTDDNGNKLAIQTLPNIDHETMVIPVGLIANADKEITFSVSETNLPNGIEIYLEDRVNNTFINLSEGNHTITTKSAVNGIGQYYIHASSARLSNDDITQNIANVSIYKSAEQEITVTGLRANATVKVISLLGEELTSTDINSNGLSKVLLPNLPTGVYVVKLNSALGNITKKIIVE